MSDLFGPWVEEKWQRRIIGVIEQCEGRAYPNHTFVFLTKHPKYLAKFNPWPDNAWVGCTITGAERPERQQEMMQALGQVEAIIKWVSYEPMLGPLAVSLNNIQWLVVGADSTRGAREPKPEWLKGIQYITYPQWYKNNLPDSWWTEPRRQEVPLT